MEPRPRSIATAVTVFVAVVVSIIAIYETVFANIEIWQRESPLIDPIAVTNIHDGSISLADGRTFRPAGVSRRDGVSPEDYDKALRVIGAQGVVVIRDLGDGSAFLLAEPRFKQFTEQVPNKVHGVGCHPPLCYRHPLTLAAEISSHTPRHSRDIGIP